MRATRSGEKTVDEAAGSGFVEATGLTIGDETTTGSPGFENAKKGDVPLVAALEKGAEETTMEKRVAAKLLLVCLVVIMARMTEKLKKQNKCMICCMKQTAPHTQAIRETPYVTSRRMIP